MAEEVGEEYGRAMAAALAPTASGPRSFRAALHAVADALTAHGFAAHAEKHGNELRIVSEHCPFGGAAVEHPVMCAVDRGMVKGMLGALYGDTVAGHRVVPRPRATRSASPPSPSLARPVAPLPRPRVDVAAAARGGRGHGRRGSTLGRRPGPDPRRGPDRPGGGRGGPRAGGRACSAPGPARWCSPSGGTEAIATATWMAAERGDHWSCPPSSTRPCGRRRPAGRGHRGRRRRPGPGRPRRGGRRRPCPTPPLVHCQLGNHEVGTLQPVAEVVAALPGARRARPRRRRPGQRPRAGRLRRARRRPAVASAPTSSAARPGSAPCSCGGACGCDPLLVGGDQERARRAGPGERAGHRRLRRGRRRAGRRRAGRRGGRRPGGSPSGSLDGGRASSDGVPVYGDPVGPAPPPRVPRHRRASRPSRCCSASTPAAWRCTRAAPARRSRSSPRPCSRPWASTPSARCGCRWAGRTTEADVDAFLAALPRVVRRPAGPGRRVSAPTLVRQPEAPAVGTPWTGRRPAPADPARARARPRPWSTSRRAAASTRSSPAASSAACRRWRPWPTRLGLEWSRTTALWEAMPTGPGAPARRASWTRRCSAPTATSSPPWSTASIGEGMEAVGPRLQEGLDLDPRAEGPHLRARDLRPAGEGRGLRPTGPSGCRGPPRRWSWPPCPRVPGCLSSISTTTATIELIPMREAAAAPCPRAPAWPSRRRSAGRFSVELDHPHLHERLGRRLALAPER